LAGLDPSSGACGLIGWYAINLTFSLVYDFGVAWLLQVGSVMILFNQQYVQICTPLQARTAQ
jgi:hypothetical protein